MSPRESALSTLRSVCFILQDDPLDENGIRRARAGLRSAAANMEQAGGVSEGMRATLDIVHLQLEGIESVPTIPRVFVQLAASKAIARAITVYFGDEERQAAEVAAGAHA